MAKVIIVDDSRLIVKLLSGRLSSRGHEVVGTGADGEEGVKLYQQHRPDLVFLDITMPNKDGRACLAEIMQANPDAKVIMLSSVRSDEVVAECLRLGARAFINKDQLAKSDSVEVQVEQVLARAA